MLPGHQTYIPVKHLPGEKDTGTEDSDVLIVKQEAGLTDGLNHDVVLQVVTQQVQADLASIGGTRLIPANTLPTKTRITKIQYTVGVKWALTRDR